MKLIFQDKTLNIQDRMSWLIAKALDNKYSGLYIITIEKPNFGIYPEELNYKFSQNGSHIESIEIVGRKASEIVDRNASEIVGRKSSENAENDSVRDASDRCVVHMPGGSPKSYDIWGNSANDMIATADGKKFKFNGKYYTSYIIGIELPEADPEGGPVRGLRVDITLVPA
ncbi:hypothetical protein [Pseudomonas putida]|uniref:hypothetical protein n=1 Tax=Pseudomonas putida TaxID=303 RepID=UPI0009A176F5|nr:hypothetical protein [Pseudomonas putida]